MTRLSKLPQLFAIAAFLGLAGCAGKSEQQTGPLPPGDADAHVQVTNHNWLDMAIYAERGSMKVRLGTVTSMASEKLTIPRNLMGLSSSIRLIASPIGSSADYATYPVDVWPGDTIDFKIENNLGNSNVTNW